MMNNYSIKENINLLSKLFEKFSSSPRLDAEILVAFASKKTRTQLFANSEYILSKQEQSELNSYAYRRQQEEPIAYIVQHKAFWKFDLFVNKNTLIPRPETELLVEWVINNLSRSDDIKAADFGTGSGAVAISLAYENPNWQIDAFDISPLAIEVAAKNARSNNITNIRFVAHDWNTCQEESYYNLIVTNPPYVENNSPYLKKLKYEPQNALCASDHGMSAIKEVIQIGKKALINNGILVIEHGHDQAEAVNKLLGQNGFTQVVNHNDLAALPRFTTAKLAYKK